jgi:hypothetical protein
VQASRCCSVPCAKAGICPQATNATTAIKPANFLEAMTFSSVAITGTRDRNTSSAQLKLDLEFLVRIWICRFALSDRSGPALHVSGSADRFSIMFRILSEMNCWISGGAWAARMPPPLIQQVEAWAEANQTSRSDAFRRLVELGLKAKGK